MKNFALAFSCLMSTVVGAQIDFGLGQTVPNFTVTTVDGSTFDLYSMTSGGQYVVLHFLGDWNYWDEQVTPAVNQAYEAYGCGTADVAFIGLNYSNNGDASTQTFIDNFGYLPPVASFDGGSEAVIDAYGVFAYPTLVLIGPDNTVVDTTLYSGPDSTFATMQADFAAQGIATASCETGTPGCTNPFATNFSSEATEDDGSCYLGGCTIPTAINYVSMATVEDGSCVFAPDFCGTGTYWDPSTGLCIDTGCADLNGDGDVNAQDVLLLVGQYGGTCP